MPLEGEVPTLPSQMQTHQIAYSIPLAQGGRGGTLLRSAWKEKPYWERKQWAIIRSGSRLRNLATGQRQLETRLKIAQAESQLQDKDRNSAFTRRLPFKPS